MKIDNELILKLEQLSRLSLDKEEQDQIKRDLENILDMVAKLQELDTDGVEPLKYMTNQFLSPREDKAQESEDKELLLSQVPRRKEDYIVIPKVIDKN
jgi:aspartyl-tRNA(Asn)/glutamyl-tRNA(Gln) amidotransferase subunit C